MQAPKEGMRHLLMSYRIEELISVKGRVKIWRSIHGRQDFTRSVAVAEAAKIIRQGLGKIRIRRNRTTPKPKEGDTK